jgi:hypothetical protein
MANKIKPDSGRVPITTADEVRHFAGPIADHSVVEILELRPTVEQLEIAALHARGQSVRPEKAAEELSGLAGLLYEVLMQDEIYLPEDR